MHSENCRQLLSLLSDYIDGELGQELCQRLEAHLAGCENCRIVIDTLRKTVYLYRVSTKDPTMPEEVRQRLYRRLDLTEFLDAE